MAHMAGNIEVVTAMTRIHMFKYDMSFIVSAATVNATDTSCTEFTGIPKNTVLINLYITLDEFP